MNIADSKHTEIKIPIQKSTIEIINAKIQYADFKLKKFIATVKIADQTPGRASAGDTTQNNSQVSVFDTIEKYSLYITKLLYLRANITEYNSNKIFTLLSASKVKSLPLKEIKNLINI